MLMACLTESRSIYNGMLETARAPVGARRDIYRAHMIWKRVYRPWCMFSCPHYIDASLSALQVPQTFSCCLRGINIPGMGFPRFKKPNRWHSVQLRQYGKDCYLHEDKKHLIVPKKLGHFLKIKLHRPVGGIA